VTELNNQKGPFSSSFITEASSEQNNCIFVKFISVAFKNFLQREKLQG